MEFNSGKTEFSLVFTTGAYMALKSELKTENLRRTLLQAASKENYEPLARGIKAFSDGKAGDIRSAYACIDNYRGAHECSNYDVFLQFIVELGENGFFKDAPDLERIRAMAEAPDMDVDMEELTNEAMKMFKGEAMKELVQEMVRQPATMTTGASISAT